MTTTSPKNQRRNEIILKLAGKTSYGVIAHRLGIARSIVAGVVHRAKRQGWQPCQRKPIERLMRSAIRGEQHPQAKLTEEAVRIIRSASRVKGMGAQLARRYGVSKRSIYNIRHGQNWKHVTLEAAE